MDIIIIIGFALKGPTKWGFRGRGEDIWWESTYVLAGDFNQLSTNVIAERTGLSPLVHQPTRGANTLDQVLVSAPKYLKVHVYTSVVCSDHIKAIIAYADPVGNAPAKTTFQRTYRKKTPTQNAVISLHERGNALETQSDPTQPMTCKANLDPTHGWILLLL